jgi:cell division protein FtsW
MAIMLLAGGVMYFVSGSNFKHILLVGVLGLIAILTIIFSRSYIMERIVTFINPASDPLTSGYQIQQSLIAIGSGGFSGRGFGQSIQKFNFLPEPIGDSIFAVISEEFGFLGATFLILMFVALLIQSVRISLMSRDSFGGLLMIGIAILIVSQSFLNIASMLAIFPLSGLPLLFVSHGGTALLFTLAASGIMLNISRFKKQ